MKRKLLALSLLVSMSLGMTSCYTYTMTVGDGPQSGATVKGKNHYFIGGLATGNVTDPHELAGDIDNYEVKIQHSFVDGLVGALTLGIYTPITTTIQK